MNGLRGVVWNTTKNGLLAKKKVLKAIDKEVLIADYEDEHSDYFFKKLLNLCNSRHTKGYYYALSIELFGIIQKYDIHASDETIRKVKAGVIRHINSDIIKLQD